ncbi:hypothetical protein MASR2M78_07600 [Treponema sp.]
MRKRYRLGIRSKLLGFYTVALLAVALLDLAVQVAAYGAAKDFEGRLSRYHSVHRLRLSLDNHFKRAERILRESNEIDQDAIDQDMQGFWFTLSLLENEEAESLNAFFNVQAVRRGMDAYWRYLGSAVQRRQAQEKDWYLDFASAGRIASYVDGYLSSLLSESLDSGERQYRAVVQRISVFRVASLTALAFFTIFFGIFAIAFSASVASPIKRLAQAAERIAAGDLEVEEVNASTGDEVETLAQAFNIMSRNLRSMVEDLRGKAELEKKLREEERELLETEAALREAQFMSLQDQIRPHFLFNALNTISRTALFEGAPDTERLSLALAKLLRYSLFPSESLVSVNEEAEILREYLAFQEIRFGERLHWDIRVDSGAGDILMPRFTLQPLVENAVRHGIEPLEKGGRVEVIARKRRGRLYLLVIDSGIGMNKQEAQDLIRGTKAGGAQGGLGFRNIVQRLELRYGGEERISVRSQIGGGTEVRVSFPSASIQGKAE